MNVKVAACVLTSSEGVYGIKLTIAKLLSGSSALDALECGIQQVEDDIRAYTVGYGGAPNLLGVVECDASVMDGSNLMTGAVGAITGCKHPITAARKVMEVMPHVFLVGAGASRFAKEMGVPQHDLYAQESKEKYKKWLTSKLSSEQITNLADDLPLAPLVSFATRSNLSKGTVTFLVQDNAGNIYGGVSTSGWAYKYPGRLGDSPVIGAGLYVDNRYGGASCTHTGEMTIRAGTARSVILYMKKGASVEDACNEAILDLQDLKGGYKGPVIIHAIDKTGKFYVISSGGDSGEPACYWQDGMQEFELVHPRLASSSTI